MLTNTSKAIKKLVEDKKCLFGVVYFSTRFWSDTRNGISSEWATCQFVLRQLTVLTVRLHIITLKVW